MAIVKCNQYTVPVAFVIFLSEKGNTMLPVSLQVLSDHCLWTTPLLFSDAQDWTDVVLVAGERDFHLSRAVLCIASPVFKAMLTQDFKEKNAERIELPEDVPSALEELLLFISPAHTNELTSTHQNTHMIATTVTTFKRLF